MGITKAEYDKLLADQHGVCAACGWGSKGTLVIDHDHRTNEVRGLLCANCNLLIGHAHDDPEILRGVAKYLEHRS